MTNIFISYSRLDEAFARQLASSLSQAGADVWIDVEDIPVGMNWSTAIQQGLDSCDAMIVIISPGSMDSKNVENEWQYFLDQSKPIVPILWQPAKIHFQLNRIQYVDFYNNPYETALDMLFSQLDATGLHDLKPARSIPPPTGQFQTPPVAAPPPQQVQQRPSSGVPHWLVGGFVTLSVIVVVGVVGVFVILFNLSREPENLEDVVVAPTEVDPTQGGTTTEPTNDPDPGILVPTDVPPTAVVPPTDPPPTTVDAPTASFSALSSADVDEVITFNAVMDANATTYMWDFGDGHFADGPNAEHAYHSAGNYTVTLTMSGPGGDASAAQAVTVSEAAVVVDTGFPRPAVSNEDCIPYDPDTLRVVDNGDSGWLLQASNSRMMLLDTEADAQRMLAVAQAHTARCFVGRGNTSADRTRYITSYFVGGSGPSAFRSEDCIGYDNSNLELADLGDNVFRVQSGSSALDLALGTVDAHDLLIVWEAFSRVCYVGRSNGREDRSSYIYTYFRP